MCFLRVEMRSEEHTSELQSRGLISYAVFCLKKKKLCRELLCRPTFTLTAQEATVAGGAVRGRACGCHAAVRGRTGGRRACASCSFFLIIGRPRRSTPFPYPALFR